MKLIKNMNKEELDQERERVRYMLKNFSYIAIILALLGLPINFIAYRFAPEYNLYGVYLNVAVCVVQIFSFAVCLVQLAQIRKRLDFLNSRV